MTTIRQLSVEDTLTDADSVPFSPAGQGDARRFSFSPVAVTSATVAQSRQA